MTTERIPGCARGDDRKRPPMGVKPVDRVLIAGGPAERTGPRAPIRATSPCPARPSRLGIGSFRVRPDRERSRTNKRRATLSALCAPSNTSSFCGDAGRAEGEALLSIAFAAELHSLPARAAPTQRAVAGRCCACPVWQLMCERNSAFALATPPYQLPLKSSQRTLDGGFGGLAPHIERTRPHPRRAFSN